MTFFSNSSRKYLFYALGEIILVMVGILLALQVNNWNEIRKNIAKERVYLTKMASNLEADTSFLAEIIRDDIQMLEELKKYSLDIRSLDDVRKLESKNSKFRVNLFYPNKTTIDNIISSGQLELIQNGDLIDSLLLYYRSIAIVQDGIDRSLKNYSTAIEEFFMSFDHVYNDPILKKKSIEEYRSNPTLLNSIYYKSGLLIRQIGKYELLKQDALEILILIHSELNKLK